MGKKSVNTLRDNDEQGRSRNGNFPGGMNHIVIRWTFVQFEKIRKKNVLIKC